MKKIMMVFGTIALLSGCASTNMTRNLSTGEETARIEGLDAAFTACRFKVSHVGDPFEQKPPASAAGVIGASLNPCHIIIWHICHIFVSLQLWLRIASNGIQRRILSIKLSTVSVLRRRSMHSRIRIASLRGIFLIVKMKRGISVLASTKVAF